MPPLSRVPQDRLPPPNSITQRVTMDFSLLSLPLSDLLQGRDNHKPAAGQMLEQNQEENTQVLSVTLCAFQSLLTVVQILAY